MYGEMQKIASVSTPFVKQHLLRMYIATDSEKALDMFKELMLVKEADIVICMHFTQRRVNFQVQ